MCARASSAVQLVRRRGWPRRRGARGGAPSAYGSQHQAVRVLSEPSLMILSGPIDERGRRPVRAGRRCAGRAAITSSSPSAYVAIRTRSRSQPGVPALDPLGGAAGELEVDDPDDARAAAAASRRAAVGLGRGAVGADQLASSSAYAANHSFSRTTVVAGTGSPSAASAALLSQPWWPSPAISTTGVTPETSSSSATVTSRAQPPGRWPQPMTGRPGASVTRSATSAIASSGERAPVEVDALRGQRPLAEVHVLVPQPGDQPAPVGVDLVASRRAGRAPDRPRRPAVVRPARRPGRREGCRPRAPGPGARPGSAGLPRRQR